MRTPVEATKNLDVNHSDINSMSEAFIIFHVKKEKRAELHGGLFVEILKSV